MYVSQTYFVFHLQSQGLAGKTMTHWNISYIFLLQLHTFVAEELC